jgi:hypothetical protein
MRQAETKLRQVSANKDIAAVVESCHRNQLKVMCSDIATAETFTTGRHPIAFAVCPDLPIAVTQPQFGDVGVAI